MRSHREDRAVNVSADVALVVRLNALPNTPAARKKHGYKGDHKQPCGPGKSWHCESPRLIFRDDPVAKVIEEICGRFLLSDRDSVRRITASGALRCTPGSVANPLNR